MLQNETHVMLDLETLAVVPWACVLSVGAVSFHPDGTIIDKFYANVDPKTCMELGLIADPNVAEWWAHPDRATARKAFSENKLPIKEVIDMFTTWFRGTGASKVWAHGSTFDIPIWDTVCSFSKKSVPWSFRDVRDTRTVFDLAEVDFTALKKEGAYHNALDDAVNQTRALCDALKAIGCLR